jgi:hypothetical protein
LNNRLKRRLFALERTVPVPLTAQRYFEHIEQRVQRMGLSREEATKSLLAEMSLDDLNHLSAELEQIVFGGRHGRAG